MADEDCGLCQLLYCGGKIAGADVQSFIARMLCNIRDNTAGGGSGGSAGPEYQVLYDPDTYQPVVVRIIYGVDGNPTGSTAFNLDGTAYGGSIAALVPSTQLESPVYQAYDPPGANNQGGNFAAPGNVNVPPSGPGVNRLLINITGASTAAGPYLQVVANTGSGSRYPLLGQNPETGLVTTSIDPSAFGNWVFDIGGFGSIIIEWNGSGTGGLVFNYIASGGN